MNKQVRLFSLQLVLSLPAFSLPQVRMRKYFHLSGDL